MKEASDYLHDNLTDETTLTQVNSLFRETYPTWLATEPPSDADAQNFFTRAGITDSTQKTAINTLTTSLKSAGLWTKMRALYPLVGGTAASHSHNLKSSSYQLTYAGPMAHSSDGIMGAGGIAETGLNIQSTTPESLAIGAYCKTNSPDASPDIGSYLSPYDYSITSRWNGDGVSYGNLGNENDACSATIGDSRGFWIVSRITAHQEFYRNGGLVGSIDAAQGPQPNSTWNIAGAQHIVALAFISDGLSDVECSQLSTMVETCQTALGRQNP